MSSRKICLLHLILFYVDFTSHVLRNSRHLEFYIFTENACDIFMPLRALMDANYRVIAFSFTVIGEKMIKYFVYIWSKKEVNVFCFLPISYWGLFRTKQ